MSIDKIERKLVELNDAICYHERMAGMGYTVIVVPHDITQPVRVSMNGTPIARDPERALELALAARNADTDENAWRAR